MPSISGSSLAALVRLGALGRHAWHAALQQVLPLACDLMEVDRASYWSVRSEPPSIVCDLGYVREPHTFERGAVLLEADEPAYFAEVRRGPFVVWQRSAAADRADGFAAYLRDRSVRAFIDVPIHVGGSVVGVLCNEQARDRQWGDRDVELALTLGQAMTALLEARARTDAEQRERRAVFLSEVSSALARTLEPVDLANAALNRAIPRFGEMAALHVVRDGALHPLSIRHADATRQRALEELVHAGLDQGPGIRTLRQAQSLLVPHVDARLLRAFGVREELTPQVEALSVRSAMAVPLRSRERPLGALTLASTSRMYTEEDLRDSELFAQLVAGHLESAQLHAVARDALEARDEFLSLAAHEIRTPITSILLATEVLVRAAPSERSSSEPTERAVATVARQSRRLAHLADLILEAAQSRRDPARHDPEPLELGALVREVVATYELATLKAGCTLTLDAPRPVPVTGDPTALRMVVSTLLDNAIKFGAGEPIEVTVERREETASLRVRDHGIGIERERLARLFSRYQRGVPLKHFGGLGLGLHVAARVVERHAGRIAVESERREGATVTVTLPLSERPPDG